jgi:hypothetical protein
LRGDLGFRKARLLRRYTPRNDNQVFPKICFTLGRDKTRIVKMPRIVPNGMKMHEIAAITKQNM